MACRYLDGFRGLPFHLVEVEVQRWGFAQVWWSMLMENVRLRVRTVLGYCCAVPFTTSANGSSSPEVSFTVAEKTQ